LAQPGQRIGADDVDYAFMADTVDDDRIVVVERWADEQTLAVHFAQHQP
jgi:quinol monooxygenase YgiN